MQLDRFHGIRKLMDEAFEKSDLSLARRLANEYLELANEFKTDWNYGNAIHHANLILGRIALKENKIELAKEYLIKAGQTPGSPQLNSFGPNMSLAKELLEDGEQDIVIEYCNLTTGFWMKMFSEEKVMEWKKEINDNKIPEFGANLLY